MINLKKYFQPNLHRLTVSKTEREVLECFVTNRPGFEDWLHHRPQSRVRFQFYYPTAIDFYFDDFQLFTAFFKKSALGNLELQEFKMTAANYTTIRSANWKPFEEVILQFLHYLEEKNKIQFFQRTSSLHEYVSICEKPAPANSHQRSCDINPSIAAG
jgi:hypothetical protein